MNELKTICRRMGIYYLLLAVNIIPCAGVLPDVFPTRNSSTVYLLILSVCLVLYYSHRVTPSGSLSLMMKLLAWTGLLLILLRGIKYSAFSEVGVLARHTWYLYYVPMLLFPLLLFYIALLIMPKKAVRLSRGWYWMLAVTVVFVVLVLTNDRHELVFRFRPGFENWDGDYTRTPLFYVITAWQYAVYFAAITVLAVKSRLLSAKKYAWIIMIPFVIGIVMNVLLLTERMPKINGVYIVEFPETLVLTAAVVLECCIQLGMIPTNTDYGKLFRSFSICAQITDRRGIPVYASRSARALTAEQFALPDGARIGEHVALHKMELPGGYGFWQDDMTELDRLNEELSEARALLEQESELIRLRNELKEKQTVIEQRTLVYDTIAGHTQRQSQLISQIARTGRLSQDLSVKEACRNRITLLGAYIKRYANLTLLGQEYSAIPVGELALSVSEVLRYLNRCGIPGEYFNSADCMMPSDAALTVFEIFETLLEENYDCLHGVFVNLSGQDRAVLKLTFENMSEALTDEMSDRLTSVGVMSEVQQEDDVTYICFTVLKGGEGV